LKSSRYFRNLLLFYEVLVDNDSVATFADRIKELREKHGFNQKEFADKIGVTSAHISRAEKGKGGFSQDILAIISQEFSVSLDWLFFGDETRYVDNKGRALPMNGDFVLVPILDQKVSAGTSLNQPGRLRFAGIL
jgi:transcriptional regulator with XRE-family HTH domain